MMKTNFKNSIYLMLAIGATMLTVYHTQAQQRGPQGPPPIPDQEQLEEMVTELSNELSLTDAQKDQISELSIAHFDEVSALRDKNKSSIEAEQKEMEHLKTSFEKEVKSLLSEAQQEQFDEFQKNHDPRKGGQPGPRH